MIDHIELKVTNLDLAYNFYTHLLESIGYKCLKKRKDDNENIIAYGFGMNNRVYFWIASSSEDGARSKVHLAFSARSKDEVFSFHKMGLELGAKDNGKPGYRLNYSPNYYAAFLIDMDGNNIEAVLRE